MAVQPGPIPAELGKRVSRETAARLEAYVALLATWQESHNLVGPGTLAAVWTRHIADSAELVRIKPAARRWVDLGSGAGLPGLVVAILLAGTPDGHVHLIESNQRKCAFLRAAIRATGAPATVHAGRIDSVLERWRESVDCVSARALAPLRDLCSLAAPLIEAGAIGLFHKGQDLDVEYAEAARYWELDAEKHANLVGGGTVLEIRRLTPKPAD
jgi:16S rRNA (guanine527-N7)-methyltransferase